MRQLRGTSPGCLATGTLMEAVPPTEAEFRPFGAGGTQLPVWSRRPSTANDTAEEVESGNCAGSFPQSIAFWNNFPSALFVSKICRAASKNAGSAASPFPTSARCQNFQHRLEPRRMKAVCKGMRQDHAQRPTWVLDDLSLHYARGQRMAIPGKFSQYLALNARDLRPDTYQTSVSANY